MIKPLISLALAEEALSSPALMPELAPRQRQVFALSALGLGPSVVGKRLGIDHRTVSSVKAQVREKFGLDSNAELTALAILRGVILVRHT